MNPRWSRPYIAGENGELFYTLGGNQIVSHALRDGRFWQTAGAPQNTNETYDLVVVGGGISGLAAAYFYRQRVVIASPAAAIARATFRKLAFFVILSKKEAR